MTMALRADPIILKKVMHAVHMQDPDFIREAYDCIDRDEIRDYCIQWIDELMESGDTIEDFCRHTDLHFLRCVGSFCMEMWPKLRCQERGIV
jgi:hypothetical protein